MLGQSLHESLGHVRAQSLLVFSVVTTVISLAFLWEALGRDYLNLICECTPLPRLTWIFDPRFHSLCMHSHHGSWLPASCAHPTSLPDPWPRFIGSGLPVPVSLPQLSLPISGHSIPSPSYLLSLVHNGVSCEVSVQSLVEGWVMAHEILSSSCREAPWGASLQTVLPLRTTSTIPQGSTLWHLLEGGRMSLGFADNEVSIVNSPQRLSTLLQWRILHSHCESDWYPWNGSSCLPDFFHSCWF